MKDYNEIPVLLITGYLGSGKTTLLNHILNNRQGIRFAVIVNDIGEVNIDARLIQKGGIVGQDNSGDLVALQNGCICCTLKPDLMNQIDTLLSTGLFDYIVIEASGICEPAPIAQTICQMEQIQPQSEKLTDIPRLDAIVTVVDALRLKSEFGCGEALEKQDIDEEEIENLIVEQIEFCNIILLNKISEVTSHEAKAIKSVIKALQPEAKILECDYCDVPLDELIDTNLFDFEKVATSATWVQKIEGPCDEVNSSATNKPHPHNHSGHHHGHHHHHHNPEGEVEEYGISTFVYFRRKPFDLYKFDRFVNLDWPKNIIRSKGVIYFSLNRDMSYLFESAGMQRNLREAGYWFATAPKEELEIMLMRDPALQRDWDEEFGDRMVKLVFIGKDIDMKALFDSLDKCLAD